MLESLPQARGVVEWVSEYKAANRKRLGELLDFANWLENDYVPIAGGWQY
jgi:hypothetical protein